MLLSRARAFRGFRGVPGWCAAPRRHRRQAGRTDPIHGYPWTPLGTDNIAPLGRGKPWSKGLVFSIKTGLDRAERAVRRSLQRSRFGRKTPNIKPPDLQAAAAAPPAIASPDRPLRVAAIGSASFHSRQAPGASQPLRVQYLCVRGPDRDERRGAGVSPVGSPAQLQWTSTGVCGPWRNRFHRPRQQCSSAAARS